MCQWLADPGISGLDFRILHQLLVVQRKWVEKYLLLCIFFFKKGMLRVEGNNLLVLSWAMFFRREKHTGFWMLPLPLGNES
ncbi:hypothetical protein CDL12_26435 [Handroanthus impetiginosus]|uniref:Uncharacterized protein n=1 Tax=Handroanthus impetiginosus TaxID=429701 RepID=A0A2G9G779_9LAMI|nr:hypothetical protein CDL12_26435 [Handroanthus impetiginosus]